MRHTSDLQLSWSLQHAFSCDLDSDACEECLKIKSGAYNGSWPPARMTTKDTWMEGISFAENFDVRRVHYQHEHEQQNSARKNGVRSMLRKLRGLPE